MLACGRVNLGTTAFALLGGAIALALCLDHGWPMWFASLVAVLACAIATTLLGFVLARFDAARFAIATLILGLLAEVIRMHAALHVGGPLPGRAAAAQTWSIAVAALALFGLWTWIRSRGGRASRALAADERAATGLGVDAAGMRHCAFIASGSLAAAAGALAVSAARATGSSAPEFSPFSAGLHAVAASAIGGAGQPLWQVLCSVFLDLIPNSIGGRHSDSGPIITAALLVSFMVVLPGGLSAAFARMVRRRARPA